MGIGRDGKPKAGFTRGMELRGKYVLFAEGARGSLTKQAIARFKLDDGREPQKFGIGLKEIWQVEPAQVPARAWCSTAFGWPLGGGAGGGSFLYHYDDGPGLGRLRRPSQLPAIRRCRRSTNSSASRPIR